ncbi:MAG: hypothetical protein RSP_20210 [Rhodanobacter sp.]
MNRKSSIRILSAALALACAGFIAIPAAQAQVSVGVGVNVGIGVPPPPPRYEPAPAPRFGYVWAPGYWMWNPRQHRHIWVGGRWVRARPGWRYLPPHWVHGPHGNWRFRDGYWTR